MIPSGNADSAEALVEHFYKILTSAGAQEEAEIPAPFHEMEKVRAMHAMLWGARKLARALRTGELEFVCRERGVIVGELKYLQSNLKHLTFQAQRIAAGDYTQRVDYLGDFSSAFNTMTEQLAGTFNTLSTKTEEYKERSERDPLTGLYNRNGFFLFAAAALREAGLSVSTLIIADIDHFKRVNDTFGHACGDTVLRAFSEKLHSLLRTMDLCCRYGGEEFVILMPGAPLATGLSVAERLRAAVEEMRILCESGELRITASFGLCGLDGAELGGDFAAYMEKHIRAADEKLYQAKASGRNRVVS